jgi:hypothetical protein
MFVHDARACCPDLICLPCQYTKYEKVSWGMYQIFLKYSHQLQVQLWPDAFNILPYFRKFVEGIDITLPLIADARP